MKHQPTLSLYWYALIMLASVALVGLVELPH